MPSTRDRGAALVVGDVLALAFVVSEVRLVSGMHLVVDNAPLSDVVVTMGAKGDGRLCEDSLRDDLGGLSRRSSGGDKFGDPSDRDRSIGVLCGTAVK